MVRTRLCVYDARLEDPPELNIRKSVEEKLLPPNDADKCRKGFSRFFKHELIYLLSDTTRKAFSFEILQNEESTLDSFYWVNLKENEPSFSIR